jgi:hypothetical protein
MGTVERVPGSKVTPSSVTVAAIWVMRRMISCSSPGNARPRMSMSRVTRRAPNWARRSPPLRTKCCRPSGWMLTR